jgi:flagellar biosynthesis/type III secretory pathway protein FliH
LPSFRHEYFIALLRHLGDLARLIVRQEVALPPRKLIARNDSGDLSQLEPVQRLADHVITFHPAGRSADGGDLPPALVIIVEVQLRRDRRKAQAWPGYVVSAMARFKCEVVLLVITEKRSVAKWAKGPFGTAQMPLRPVVFCLDELPQQLSSSDAQLRRAIAVLDALAHPSEQTLRSAFESIKLFPSELRELTYDALRRAAPSALIERMEEKRMLPAHMFKSRFARYHIARGKKMGLEEGREVGREEGREEVQKKWVADLQGFVLEVMRSKLGRVSAAEKKRIRGMEDDAALRALHANLVRAADAKQARAAVTRAMAN